MRDLLLPPRHPSPTTHSSAGHDEFNDISGQDEFKVPPAPLHVASAGHDEFNDISGQDEFKDDIPGHPGRGRV